MLKNFLHIVHIVLSNNDIWENRFAWWPIEYEEFLSSSGSLAIATRFCWMKWYWRLSGPAVTPRGRASWRKVSPNVMTKIVELDRQQSYLKGQYTGGPASGANAVSFRPLLRLPATVNMGFTFPPEQQQAIKKIVEEYMTELEHKFLDEIFAMMPANAVPQEQVDKIYEAMGYNNTGVMDEQGSPTK
jgi:hypothetical protein